MTPTPEPSAAPLVARLREKAERVIRENPTATIAVNAKLFLTLCAALETAQQGEGDRPVTDADVEAVEAALGMGHGAWDMLDPKTIIAAARRAAPTPERA